MVLDRPDGIKSEWFGHLGQTQFLAVNLSIGEGVIRVLKDGGVTNVHGVLLVLSGGSIYLAISVSGVFLTF
jgi:hypothetical protein